MYEEKIFFLIFAFSFIGCNTSQYIRVESQPSNALIRCGEKVIGMTPLLIDIKEGEESKECQAFWFGGKKSQVENILFTFSEGLNYTFFLKEKSNEAFWVEQDIHRKMRVLEKEREEESSKCGCGGD